MSRLRPLFMNGFEEFLLADDRPGYSKTFALDLTIQGEIDRESFEVGLAQALARHPLLSALVKHRGWLRPRWIPAPHVRPQVYWGVLGDPLPEHAGDGIDITCELGVRFYVQ